MKRNHGNYSGHIGFNGSAKRFKKNTRQYGSRLSNKNNGMLDLLNGPGQSNNEGNPMEELMEMFGGKKKEDERVYQEYNHIYFEDVVTEESVRKLIGFINEANREHERLVFECPSTFTFPKPLYLHINTPGGCMFSGFLAYDSIKKSKIPIYTVSNGQATSSGATMFMAGKKRFMNLNSYVLIHQLNESSHGGTKTNMDMVDNVTNNLELMSRMYNIYLNEFRHAYSPVDPKYVLTKDILEEHMLHDIYWNFQTCFNYGLADGLYTNYQDREEVDRKEFYSNLLNNQLPLPTYKEVTGEFESNYAVTFDDKKQQAYHPGKLMIDKLCVIAKEKECRKRLEKALEESAINKILNEGGFGEVEVEEDENKCNVDEGDTDEVRVIETRSKAKK
jgi:ATP-dependent protease ClpP protease subunit